MNEIKNDFPPYVHLDPTLKQIRVLTIHAAPSSAEVCCSLSCTSLAAEDHTAYEAAPYCWDHVKTLEIVQLNGHDFGVTQSARRALRSFRQ
jgi:hypothetical protein